MVAFEIIHHMKKKTRGKKGEFSMKIDISKAYNHVDWTFLCLLLLKMGFADKFVDLIMMCITTI